MKELLQSGQLHLQTVFSIKKAAAALLFITVSCYFNYYTSYRLWPPAITSALSFLWLSTLFVLFFVTGYLLVSGKPARQNRRYEWMLIVAPVLFAAKIALPFEVLIPAFVTAELQHAFYQPAYWLAGFLFISFSILLLHRLYEKRPGFYYTGKTGKLKPYLLLLAFMIPLLLLASVQDNFQQVYPKSKALALHLNNETSWKHYLFFEFAYIADFITVELFFRGLLIATMSRVLGIHCILPAALFYFSIHLGKPMQEALSSFFGGLILGSIAYQTRSIWGGCLVHIGIALIMELLATLF